MNTKFTLMAGCDSGKSLALKVLEYLILREFSINGFSIKEVRTYSGDECNGKPFPKPELSDYPHICPRADVKVINIISINGHEIILVIYSATDIAVEVEKCWDVYQIAEKIANGRPIIFISPCHYKDNGGSYDKEVDLRINNGFLATPIYDFVISVQKYNPHMDVCVYQDKEPTATFQAIYKQPTKEEIKAMVSEINKLHKNTFHKHRGIASSEVQENAVHRALILLQELKRFFK